MDREGKGTEGKDSPGWRWDRNGYREGKGRDKDGFRTRTEVVIEIGQEWG